MDNSNAVAVRPSNAQPKVSDHFKNTIKQHLNQLAAADPLFAETLKKPGKNIDDCVTYIINQVKASGICGFEDSEIFGMAVHYYDEDDIKPGSPINYKVVVNHSVQLTEEEISQAKQNALAQVISEEKARIQKKGEQKKDKSAPIQQPLF
ncbi:PcfK-like family protein [Dyadobacter soli]|nr:PcfK-like family protein [Dyadobacter soli]